LAITGAEAPRSLANQQETQKRVKNALTHRHQYGEV
jgi:hypothetical protein